MRFLVNW